MTRMFRFSVILSLVIFSVGFQSQLFANRVVCKNNFNALSHFSSIRLGLKFRFSFSHFIEDGINRSHMEIKIQIRNEANENDEETNKFDLECTKFGPELYCSNLSTEMTSYFVQYIQDESIANVYQIFPDERNASQDRKIEISQKKFKKPILDGDLSQFFIHGKLLDNFQSGFLVATLKCKSKD